jgi:hypothetical protein
VLLFVLFVENSHSEALDSSLIKFFSKPDDVRNQITLNANYGTAFADINQPSNNNINISRAYRLSVDYGFTRIYPLKNSKTMYYASEFISLSNISSGLDPSKTKVGIPLDFWQIAIGYRNGYVLSLGAMQTILYHSNSINWSRSDFPNYKFDSISPLNLYDETFRFGTNWESGLTAKISYPLFFNVGFENSLIFPDFKLAQYAGSAIIELLTQRIIDFSTYLLIDKDQTLVPLLNFFLKNSVSLLFYEQRKKSSFYPFNSSPAMNIYSLKFGFSFILDSFARELK